MLRHLFKEANSRYTDFHLIYTGISTSWKIIWSLFTFPQLLWNHSYSWGPMFVVCQDYASSCGFNFLGNWFVALQCKAIVIALLNVCGDVNLTHEIHEYYTPPPRTMMIPQYCSNSWNASMLTLVFQVIYM